MIRTSARRRPSSLSVCLIAMLALGAGMLGCAALLPQAEGEYIPPEVLEVLDGWIVSMDEEIRSLTVKDSELYQTWTVSILEETRIRTRDGDYLAIADLRIGDHVEVRGTSRVKNHVAAHDVELLEDRKTQDSGLPKM